MGSGRGAIDISLICKLVALILCAISLALNNGLKREELVSNSIIYATGGFIIVIAMFMIWALVKGEVDSLFAGVMLVCGAIFNIGAGLGVVLYYLDNQQFTTTYQLLGGVFAVAAGVVMIVDAVQLGIF